jgi:hypothetical protein
MSAEISGPETSALLSGTAAPMTEEQMGRTAMVRARNFILRKEDDFLVCSGSLCVLEIWECGCLMVLSVSCGQ